MWEMRTTLTSHNGLWYSQVIGHLDYTNIHLLQHLPEDRYPQICQMTQAAEFLLWHKRLGCPGATQTKIIHKHLDNCPQLCQDPLFRCDCCMKAKVTYTPVPQKMKKKQKPPATPEENTAKTESRPPATEETPNDMDDLVDDDDDERIPNLQPGQWFQTDLGFVRGSGFDIKDEGGRRIMSLDGYNSYLVIVDHKT